jgi:hypothetical protein
MTAEQLAELIAHVDVGVQVVVGCLMAVCFALGWISSRGPRG